MFIFIISNSSRFFAYSKGTQLSPNIQQYYQQLIDELKKFAFKEADSKNVLYEEADLGPIEWPGSKMKKVPNTYLCHLCFMKGHFIEDCPKVSARVSAVLHIY